uniref:Uncharacterized protein n=1 Tax=Anguilla anguilla TaxID=7936 RepID=A0A0E9XQR5_ANGAN
MATTTKKFAIIIHVPYFFVYMQLQYRSWK